MAHRHWRFAHGFRSMGVFCIMTVLFDFDGTISTLRYGWEQVMEPLMVELLGHDQRATIQEYIDQSTGIQTILQMEWLADQVKARQGSALSPWEYKAEYNRRLMATVTQRREDITSGRVNRDAYLMAGSIPLLDALTAAGATLLVASGTDGPDVVAEVEVLGLSRYFKAVSGAPLDTANCPKEGAIRALLATGVDTNHLAVVGDGKVEIMVGNQFGARTLGLASDEAKRQGINPIKEKRLQAAGADKIVGDFLDTQDVLDFLLYGGRPT